MTYLRTLFFLAVFSASSSFGQVNPHAIGARFDGSHFGHFGAEFSYQHGIGEKNRLEFDAGLRSHRDWSHLGLSVIFHWDWNIVAGFNWFIGPGGQIGFWRDKGPGSDYFGVAAGGQVGVEYDFNYHDVPILVGVDVRPMFDFLGTYSGFGYGSALSVRYTW